MPLSVTIFALHGSREAAESTAARLIQSSTAPSDIPVLLPEQLPAFTHDTSIEPRLANRAAAVPASRGVFSGALGVLAGLSMLALPGLGPLVGEGTLKAGLAGLGVNGAVGNFAQYLINLGVPELEAKRYEDRLQPSTTSGVAARTAAEPTPAAHETYRFIDRTMHKVTPKEFEDTTS